MKLQRTSLILLISSLVLGGIVYVVEIQGAPQRETAKAKAKQVFSFKEDQIQALTVTTGQRILKFTRATAAQTSKSQTPTRWLLTIPGQVRGNDDIPADDGAVAYLLSLLTTGQSSNILTVPATQRSEFGLEPALTTIDITLKNQQTHKLLLGTPDFSGGSIYAQADPGNGAPQVSVLLLPTQFSEAVARPLNEWQAQSPSPSPSPAASASPSSAPSNPAASPTPTGSSAPSVSPTPSSPTSASPTPISPSPQTRSAPSGASTP